MRFPPGAVAGNVALMEDIAEFEEPYPVQMTQAPPDDRARRRHTVRPWKGRGQQRERARYRACMVEDLSASPDVGWRRDPEEPAMPPI